MRTPGPVLTTMPPRRLASAAASSPSSSSEGTDTDDEVQKVVEQQQQQHYALRAPPPPPPAPAPMHGAPQAPQPPAAVPAPPLKPAGKAGKAGSKPSRRPAGAITIKTLVDAGLLIPGVRTLTVDYKQTCYYADLSQEGQIHCNGLVFDSPSAFSIYIKRLVNPTRKADDGWKSVKYAGKLLETYKDDYLRMQQPLQPGDAGATDKQGGTGTSSRGGRTSSSGGGRQTSSGNGVTGLPAAKRHRASEPSPPLVGTTAPQQLALAQHTTSGPSSRHLHNHLQQQPGSALLVSGSQPMHDMSTGPPQPPPPAVPPLLGTTPAPPPPPLPPPGPMQQPELPVGPPVGLPPIGMAAAQPVGSDTTAGATASQLMGAAVAAQAFG